MLNLILKTFENNPEYTRVKLDGFMVEKSDFEVIDKENSIIKYNKTFINLNPVKVVQFENEQDNEIKAITGLEI